MVPPCFHCGLSMSFTWSAAIPLWLMAGTDQDLRLRRPEDAGAPSRVKSSSRVAESQNPSQKPVWQSLDRLSENDTKFLYCALTLFFFVLSMSMTTNVSYLRFQCAVWAIQYSHESLRAFGALKLLCYIVQSYTVLHLFMSSWVSYDITKCHKMSLDDVTRRQKMSHKQNTLRRLWHFLHCFFECLAVWHWNFNIWFSDVFALRTLILASWKELQVTCNKLCKNSAKVSENQNFTKNQKLLTILTCSKFFW